MKIIKNFLPNLMYVLGYILVDLGDKLHIRFNTDMGKHLKAIKNITEESKNSDEALIKQLKNKKGLYFVAKGGKC